MIAKPALPGTVIRFTGSQAPRIPPSASDVVALPIIADWGPVGSDPAGPTGKAGGPQELLSFSEYTGTFGDSDTAGRTAVAGAFAGQGLPGSPGAGAVIVWRMATPAAAVATLQLTSTAAGTPAELKLDGKYVGTRGNRLTVTVDSNPSDVTQDRLRIYLDGLLQESYLYKSPNLAALVAVINANSTLVVASALVLDGVANRLTQHVVPVAFAGGNDGAVVTSTEHLAALAGLQYKQFGILAPYNLTSAPILASYLSWVQAQEAANRPCRLVVGGAAGETVDSALARTLTLADAHVVNFGCGTYHDDLLGKDLSTAQLAPRIAGILAAKSEEHALTFAKIAGLHVVTGPADDEIAIAVAGGVTVLAPTSSPDADLRIEKGVTTYTGDTPTKPQDVFGDPRLVGIMDNYVRNMKEWGDDIIIGDLPVNDDTRAEVRGHARSLQDDLLRRGLILPGDDVTIPRPYVVCEDPGDPALEDAIPYTFGWQFAKTANAILGEGAVR